MKRNAVFPTLDEAMRFMAQDRGGRAARPVMAKAASDRLYSGDEVSLAGENGAAQRGMIESCLRDLDKLYLHVIMARYVPRHSICDHCRQPCLNPVWWAHVQTISNAALQIGVINSHSMKRSARDAAVARFFGHKVPLAQAAEEAEISLRTMNTLSSRIGKWLGGSRVEKNGSAGVVGVEQLALADTEVRLLRAGHIAESKYC